MATACNAPGHPGANNRASQLQQGPLEVSVGRADLSLDRGRVVLQAAWGNGAGEVGKRDEASRPGPMSLAVDPQGRLLLLDQINRRVQRYTADGQLQAEIPITAETTEDIAPDDDGALWTLVYEPGTNPGYRVERYAPGHGEPVVSHALPRAIQLVTGLFVTGSEVWVEQEHAVQRRVVSGGKPDRGLPALPGRPDRAGRGFRLDALRSGTHEARVHAVVPGERVHPLITVTTREPLMAIQELESDALGRVYLGLLLGEGETARKVMLVVHEQQALVVELSPHRATDVFRPVAVGQDGAIYQLETTEEGALVRRWDLPADGGGR